MGALVRTGPCPWCHRTSPRQPGHGLVRGPPLGSVFGRPGRRLRSSRRLSGPRVGSLLLSVLATATSIPRGRADRPRGPPLPWCRLRGEMQVGGSPMDNACICSASCRAACPSASRLACSASQWRWAALAVEVEDGDHSRQRRRLGERPHQVVELKGADRGSPSLQVGAPRSATMGAAAGSSSGAGWRSAAIARSVRSSAATTTPSSIRPRTASAIASGRTGQSAVSSSSVRARGSRLTAAPL